MRVLLLVNSTASSVTPRNRAAARRILADRHDVELAETSRRGHATLLARAAAHDRFDVVAVLGGDGTLNEAVSGILHTDTTIAPLPGGSTNVYAQTLGYPRRVTDAAHALVDALDEGAVRRVGVGTANGRPFLFCCGIGFDASVIRRVERHGRRVKRIASHPLHVAAAFRTIVSREGRRTHATFELDNGEVVRGVRFAIVSKTTPYTFLGRRPIHLAPNAGLDTRLTLTAFTRLRVRTLVAAAASGMAAGGVPAGRSEIVQVDDLGGLVVRAPEPFAYQLDGDDVGDVDELTVGYEPGALAVVVPGARRRAGISGSRR